MWPLRKIEEGKLMVFVKENRQPFYNLPVKDKVIGDCKIRKLS